MNIEGFIGIDLSGSIINHDNFEGYLEYDCESDNVLNV